MRGSNNPFRQHAMITKPDESQLERVDDEMALAPPPSYTLSAPGPSSSSFSPPQPPASQTSGSSGSNGRALASYATGTRSEYPLSATPAESRALLTLMEGLNIGAGKGKVQAKMNDTAVVHPNIPLPPAFTRPPPKGHPYVGFKPIYLFANGKYLHEGFPNTPPPMAPPNETHLFATRDVGEEDWVRFLHDLRNCAQLTSGQKAAGYVLPITQILPIPFLGLINHPIKQSAKNKGRAGKLVEVWNYFFFRARRMELVLCHGPLRISGESGGAVPTLDPERELEHDTLRGTRSNEDDESSSSDEDHDPTQSAEAQSARKVERDRRKSLKRERKARIKAEKARRKALNLKSETADSHTRDKTYRLFVVPY